MSRPNKSSHISTCSIEVIKYRYNLISPILAVLINQSICTKTFSQVSKIDRVVSVFKSGDKQDLNNYRPISILTILRIFFKVCFNQLLNYPYNFKLINNSQFGSTKIYPHLMQ